MSDLRVGQRLTNIPDLPGEWSIWSAADTKTWGPSAVFVVPVGGHSGGGWAVVRRTQGQQDVKPRLKVLHREVPGKAARS